ncbi:hypothetical protein [Candidatus Pelagibacter sp. Uisw_134_02]|uniref:hypothetical protein n=1 Tax=Candidatus Pelagibacter sp. Uisw_134_02 TaxID=3230990 RepID=UPI0039EA9B85
MIKGIIKIILTIALIIILGIIYLSIFGIKTDKFNSQIKKSILKINQKIDIDLSDVTYLLNPYNFSIKVSTKNSHILVENSEIDINLIKTSVSLKSLINNQFSISNLQIYTEEIKIDDLIFFTRTIYNTPELFVLNTIIKDGSIAADLNINFDNEGKIKNNYQIKGFIKNVKFNLLNKFNVKDLNFSFDINSNKYSLSKIKTSFNKIRFDSPYVQIIKKKDLYLVDGTVLSKGQILEKKDLELIFGNLLNSFDITKVELSSKNNFSFTINKKFKLKDLKVKTIIDLDQLMLKEKYLNLKSFIPNAKEEIKFKNHKIKIDYKKDQLNIEGNGDILLVDNIEQLSYAIIKDKNKFIFNTKINIKHNPLIIKFLDYEKKEGVNSMISVNGNLNKNGSIKFKSIALKENKNKILIENLKLSPAFKINNITSVNIDYKNKKNIVNKLNLKKDNSNFFIDGDNLDAVKIINNIMNSDDESSSIFQKLNTKVYIKIKKTYIDEINYLNDLSGYINFKDNKIDDLKLESTFPNNKKISLTINTNKSLEKITRLFTDYPKPLIKRYDFIKGFEDGYLEFNSIKKNNISNSILVIDDFKVKEIPIFAKLLSLASLQGIADILTGEGIRFTDFEMKFSNQQNLTKIDEMYAIGPAVSILMDGYIQDKKLVSLRGTLVPATTINRSIASIPFLGDLLIGDKVGEGVFGVSFKIKGPPKNLSTTVNPIKTLTPRFITRTLENIKKN